MSDNIFKTINGEKLIKVPYYEDSEGQDCYVGDIVNVRVLTKLSEPTKILVSGPIVFDNTTLSFMINISGKPKYESVLIPLIDSMCYNTGKNIND